MSKRNLRRFFAVAAFTAASTLSAGLATATETLREVDAVAPVTTQRAGPIAPQLVPRPLQPFDPALASETEPNNAFGTATPLTLVGGAAQVQANVYATGDIDFFSFTAAAGDRVYVATETTGAANSADTNLDVIASDGTTVIESDNDDGAFGTTAATISGATLPTAGTYYIRARGNTANTNQVRPYRLFLKLQSGAPTAETEPNDTTATPNAMPASRWVSGATASTTDQDWFSLPLNAGDTVYASLDLDPERDTVEWNGAITFGPLNNFIITSNDAGGLAGPDSEATFWTVKAAGTYVFRVATATGATTFGTYQFSVAVFPAPVQPGATCTTFTSTNVPQTIPAVVGQVDSTLVIPGTPRISDLNVTLNINHTSMPDLDVTLISPQGVENSLFTDIGQAGAVGSGFDLLDLTLDDEASTVPTTVVVAGEVWRPEVNYRLAWFDGMNAGGTWTLRIRDDLTANGGTLNSWSLSVCSPPPPPTCPVGTVAATVFTTDFEAGAAGFTHSGTADEWELGLPATAATSVSGASVAAFNNCNSGTNCWKTDLDNTYNSAPVAGTNVDQDLLSPAINLTGFTGPVLVRWAMRHQIENATFDHMFVDSQQVGGSNVTRLFEWLDATPSDVVGNPAVNYGLSSGWGVFERRVDSLAGVANAQLRFHTDQDDTVNLGGLAVDDVSVTACRALSADLAITKTDGVTTAVPGGSVTYTITASNGGADPVAAATVADTFPAVETCTWTCVGAGGGTCTASASGNINDTVNLPAGGSVTYTASCAINASATGTLSNTATVSSSVTDPTPANNSATDTDTLTAQANLGITKTDGVTTVTAGGSTTYTITASNAGPSNAPGSTVADTFPASLTCTWTCAGAGGGTCTASGSGNINDTVNLPSGGSATYTASCTISGAATGTLSNTATVAAPAGVTDPTPANNSATDTDTIGASANLGITKTDGVTAVNPGGSTTYTIVASNAGPSGATGATVADTFPASLTCTWTCAGAGGGTCTASGGGNINQTVNLPSGASTTFTASCTVSAAATGTIANTATVTAPAGVTDPTPANNSATDTDTVNANADLAITKTDGVASVTAGGTTTYTITASNAGPSAATGATVTDTFPASLTCTWTCVGAGGGTCTASGSGNINGTVNLPSGGSVTYTASCNISAAASGTLANTATVAAPAGVTDPTPGNNSATDSDTVTVLTASVSGTKSVSGAAGFAPGSAVTYTIVLNNTGTGAQGDNPGNEFSDTLPAGFTFVSVNASSGTAVGAAGTVTWNGAIPAGGSVTIVINGTVSAAAAPGSSITNQGTINFDADGNGTNESSATTDNPATQGPPDATGFVVGGGVAGPVVPVPVDDRTALMLLALAVVLAGLVSTRRRSV